MASDPMSLAAYKMEPKSQAQEVDQTLIRQDSFTSDLLLFFFHTVLLCRKVISTRS
jgi:hypothetical protein